MCEWVSECVSVRVHEGESVLSMCVSECVCE